MAGHAAVGVDDDFAPGEAAVADGAADDELAGGVNVVLGTGMEPVVGQYGFDDFFHDGFADVGLVDIGVVLGGEDDGVDGDGLFVFVAEGDLAFGVGAEPGQDFVFAEVGLPFDEAVGVVDRGGHEGVGFVGGVAKHEALVTGAEVFVVGLVDAHGDVGGLFADGVEYGAGGAVEAHVGAVVANV